MQKTANRQVFQKTTKKSFWEKLQINEFVDVCLQLCGIHCAVDPCILAIRNRWICIYCMWCINVSMWNKLSNRRLISATLPHTKKTRCLLYLIVARLCRYILNSRTFSSSVQVKSLQVQIQRIQYHVNLCFSSFISHLQSAPFVIEANAFNSSTFSSRDWSGEKTWTIFWLPTDK